MTLRDLARQQRLQMLAQRRALELDEAVRADEAIRACPGHNDRGVLDESDLRGVDAVQELVRVAGWRFPFRALEHRSGERVLRREARQALTCEFHQGALALSGRLAVTVPGPLVGAAATLTNLALCGTLDQLVINGGGNVASIAFTDGSLWSEWSFGRDPRRRPDGLRRGQGAQPDRARPEQPGGLPRPDHGAMWDRPAAILTRRQGERDQAALPAYGAVSGRRGDPEPVRTPDGVVPAAPARPDPVAPMTGTPVISPESWWLRLRGGIRHNMQKGA